MAGDLESEIDIQKWTKVVLLLALTLAALNGVDTTGLMV